MHKISHTRALEFNEIANNKLAEQGVVLWMRLSLLIRRICKKFRHSNMLFIFESCFYLVNYHLNLMDRQFKYCMHLVFCCLRNDVVNV